METSGVVRVWHSDEGWGVIDSHDTPGGCWAGFSSVLVPGHRALRAGQSVTLTYEPAEQDGYLFRAVEVWPSDEEPFRTDGGTAGETGGYRSAIAITPGPE